jgi:transforming growth factor-beta-induced protein
VSSLPSLSTLKEAFDLTGLDATLSGPGPFTVCAPTDDAFAAVDADLLESVLGDTDALTDVLLYHTADGAYDSIAVVGGTFARTISGAGVNVTVTVDGVLLQRRRRVRVQQLRH